MKTGLAISNLIAEAVGGKPLSIKSSEFGTTVHLVVNIKPD